PDQRGEPVDEVVRTITLTGFDPEGEPQVRVMGDGSLLVVFNFMPPSWAEDETDLGPFKDFDRQMERAIGFASVEKARASYRKLIEEKLDEGYVECHPRDGVAKATP